MSLAPLISKGRVDGGRLEKFADGCNLMARSFWLGRHVELLKEGEDYTLKTTGDGRTLTDDWMDACTCNWGNMAISGAISLIILLGYALACIPVTIAMGVGLVAKKIVLATDENSSRYQAIVQKYLVFVDQEKELKQLNQKIKSATELLNSSGKELQHLESAGKENLSTHVINGAVKNKKESLKKTIESTKSNIETLNKNIESNTTNSSKLKHDIIQSLSSYLNNKNEQFKGIYLVI